MTAEGAGSLHISIKNGRILLNAAGRAGLFTLAIIHGISYSIKIGALIKEGSQL
jgi:hypothetical protein